MGLADAVMANPSPSRPLQSEGPRVASKTLLAMRLWLAALAALFLPAVIASAELPFPGNAPVTLFFRETLQDQVAREPDTEVADESYIVVTQRGFTIGGTARLEGFNLSELTADSPYSIV